MIDVLFAILPVFLIIVIGMLLDRWEFLPPSTSSILSMYVLRLALPVVVMRILAGAHGADIARGGFWFALVVSQFAMYGIGYAGDLLLAKRGQGPAVITGMASSCCNAAFLGLPIVANLLPGNQEAMLVAGLATVMPSFIMALAQSHLEMLQQRAKNGASGSVWPILRRSVLLNPLVIGLLIGAVVCVGGTGLWGPLDRAAAMIGATSAPCALLALGLDMRAKLRVATRSRGGHKIMRQSGISLIKLIAHPLLSWGLLSLCGVGGIWLAVGVIMTGTATAVGSYVVAEVYRTVPEECAMTVVLTNSLNLITMAGFSYVFKVMGLI